MGLDRTTAARRQVNVSLSAAEHEVLTRQADEAGVTLAALIRERAMHPVDITDVLSAAGYAADLDAALADVRRLQSDATTVAGLLSDLRGRL